ncbi:hypothetical protein [Sphingomonas sp. NFR04]|uniref:hypothetical protein n=1 Tax=Sphingomonas sp. NFR04 TaxID=1566283 RepID=UPI001114161A|nr:hypothetical protein [Sphingomonas sp. NFR04]
MRSRKTRDGFIWIAAVGGLFRYDGASISHLEIAGPSLAWSDAVTTLLPSANGDLLAGHLWGGLSIVHAGRARPLRAMEGRPFCLAESGNGIIWSVQYSIKGLSFTTLEKQVWSRETSEPITLYDYSGCATSNSGALVFLANGAFRIKSTNHAKSKVIASVSVDAQLVQGSDRRIWLWSANQLRQVFVRQSGRVTFESPADLPMKNMAALVIDRENGVWLVDNAGISKRFERRLDKMRGTWAWHLGMQTFIGRFAGDMGNPTLVDRENNVWFGVSDGLH